VSDPITISAEDRDLLYHRIMVHLSGIDRVWLAARHNDYEEADRLGRQICDELTLLLDDLGWGETRGDEPVDLTSPPQVVRRVVEFLRDEVRAEDAGEHRYREALRVDHMEAFARDLADGEEVDERRDRDALRISKKENREVREMCDRVLAALGAQGRRSPIRRRL
jgi:hypothetical protein